MALLAGLLAAGPAFAQQSIQAEAVRNLQEAEQELRDTIARMDGGGVDSGSAISRLRSALNRVERAMLGMPSEARQGAPWQTAVREVSEAILMLREEQVDAPTARAKAGAALGTLPALRGEETGSGRS
jgi:chromosome condensin MukBEF MukE localization factor